MRLSQFFKTSLVSGLGIYASQASSSSKQLISNPYGLASSYDDVADIPPAVDLLECELLEERTITPNVATEKVQHDIMCLRALSQPDPKHYKKAVRDLAIANHKKHTDKAHNIVMAWPQEMRYQLIQDAAEIQTKRYGVEIKVTMPSGVLPPPKNDAESFQRRPHHVTFFSSDDVDMYEEPQTPNFTESVRQIL